MERSGRIGNPPHRQQQLINGTGSYKGTEIIMADRSIEYPSLFASSGSVFSRFIFEPSFYDRSSKLELRMRSQ